MGQSGRGARASDTQHFFPSSRGWDSRPQEAAEACTIRRHLLRQPLHLNHHTLVPSPDLRSPLLNQGKHTRLDRLRQAQRVREGGSALQADHSPSHSPHPHGPRPAAAHLQARPRRGIQLGDHVVCRCSVDDAGSPALQQLELLARREVVAVAHIAGGRSVVLVPYMDKAGGLKLVCFILLL
ncbi:MAG: hypothetical protein WDW36_000503 [Sanguina aurantia]